MFLVDTDVISELRRKDRANPGIAAFFRDAGRDTPLYLSAVTIGELRQGVERIRHRGDEAQASMLERWLQGSARRARRQRAGLRHRRCASLGSPADTVRLIDWSVDGLITDYPDRLRKVIGRQGPAAAVKVRCTAGTGTARLAEAP